MRITRIVHSARACGCARARWPWLLVFGACVAAPWLVVRGRSSVASRASAHAAHAHSSEHESTVVACLTLGDVSPALDRLGEARAESVVSTLAAVLESYQRADFDAFSWWHHADLEFAAERQREHVDELRRLARELDDRSADVPDDWLGALRSFWIAYYDRPPIATIRPETAYFRLGEGAVELDAWDASFDAARDALDGHRIEHHLVIPHRRTVAQLRERVGALSWMDFAVSYETPEGLPGRLLGRFVWDAVDSEWFLHRAVTVHSKGFEMVSDRRNLIL